MTSVCVQVFTRAPVVGRVKTRLIADLGTAGAAALHTRMAERMCAVVASLPGVHELWVDGSIDHPWVRDVSERYNLRVHNQRGSDLGARMFNAAASAWARLAQPIVIGTDCWVLDAAYLQSAIDALVEGVDVVLGPVEDGGYVLIGLRDSRPELFSNMTWGNTMVLAETLRRCAALDLRVRQLPTLWDVDRPEDVARLRASGVTWDE